MKPETDRLGLLLHDAARTMRKRFEQRTASLGLSSAQWRLLAIVSREGRGSEMMIRMPDPAAPPIAAGDAA